MEESIKNIIARFWRTGVVVIAGLIVIVYIALGFVYFQQGGQQREFEEQIVRLSAVVARPLPSGEELQTEYDKITNALAPMTDSNAIAKLVTIAEKNGIDVDAASGKFRVPPATFSQATVGGSTYQITSFGNIHVQGDYDSVVAFISDLDSGTTLKTMVLKRVATNEVTVTFTGEEGARRVEFRNVAKAVKAMMTDNNLLELPHPMSFIGGTATNLMGDDPETGGTVEGFPDITTTVTEKGYRGNGTPRDGYVLYKHDRISMNDTTQFETVSYLDTLTTKYYYTCAADGTVRQWDGPNVVTAREYLDSEESTIELEVVLDVDIYTKP